MRTPGRPTPRDRRSIRLGSGPQRPLAPCGPTEMSGLEALGLVVSVYGAERLVGRGNKRVSDRAFRDAARRLADEARARDAVRAERLLIGLRGAWMQLPAVQRLTDAAARRALWDRVVLLCCEEFYSPSGGTIVSLPWARESAQPYSGATPN